MANITKTFTRAATCEVSKSKQEYYDDAVKGFMLEVRSNARKTFFLKVVDSKGKRKSIKIADATILDADTARTKAIKLKRSLEEGKDVILDHPIAEAQAVMTLQQFYDTYYLPLCTKTYQKPLRQYEYL